MSASEWRLGLDSPTIDIGTGAEQIARAAMLQIVQNLEAQCEVQEGLWAQRDRDWARAMGIPFAPTRITRVESDSFFLGAQPSLVAGENSRFDRWPAITVRVANRTPMPDIAQADQYDKMYLQLVVEVLARAGPFQQDPLDDRGTSDQIDRQYQRLADAVLACINLDRSLNASVLPIQRPPAITPSLPWVRKEDKGAGSFLLFQAAELAWIIEKSLY